MNVYIPTSKDYLEIDGHVISITNLKSIFIDYEKNIATYELWIHTNQIHNIPGPKGYSDIIYTERHTIEQSATLVMVSMMNRVNTHKITCLLHDSTYCGRSHRYLLRFSIKYARKQLQDDNEIYIYDLHRPLNLDFD